jgi:hypothetical protein
VIEGIAAFLAWAGASLIVLADGRRGLALGTALAAAGLSVVVWQGAGPIAALSLAAGGAIAAWGRLRSGAGGWGLMPPGSTPRIILSVAGGLLTMWVALGITSGHSAALRFSAMAVVGLAGARVLTSEAAEVQLTAVALVALAVAAAAGLDASEPAVWPYLAAAVIAASVGWLRLSAPSAA